MTAGTHGSKCELIARTLADAIGQGTYKVGAVLPSEPTLASSFGVSRHTVRAALRHLQHMGLISSQPGVGSIVRADRGKSRYTQSFDSVADLQQYASNTDFDVIGKEELVVDSELAAWLQAGRALVACEHDALHQERWCPGRIFGNLYPLRLWLHVARHGADQNLPDRPD